MRVINFAPYNSHTISLFVDNGLLKLDDIITCKIKLAFDFKNNALPVDLNELFKYCHDVHSYPTRTAFKEGFFVPMIKSTTYGINTLRYSVPVVWNKFSNLNNQLSNIKTTLQLKKLLKTHFIAQYKKSDQLES